MLSKRDAELPSICVTSILFSDDLLVDESEPSFSTFNVMFRGFGVEKCVETVFCVLLDAPTPVLSSLIIHEASIVETCGG